MSLADLPRRLRTLADDMTETGLAMATVGGYPQEAASHGREMIHAAVIARQWADEFERMQLHAHAIPGDHAL